MQPNKPPDRPPRPPDTMYGSHSFETTVNEQGETVIRDLGPRVLHPWGPKGYQEDWKPDFSTVPDKRPHTLEKEANEILADRAKRNNSVSSNNGAPPRLRDELTGTEFIQGGERESNSERLRSREMEREDTERHSGQGDNFPTDHNDNSESKLVLPPEESDDQEE